MKGAKMSKQTEIAMKIFSDVYGYPNWEVKAKEGQNALEIIKIWEDELKDYDPEQVKQACYRVIKYRKAQTFPTISHLMAELCDQEKNLDTKDDVQRCLRAILNHQPPFDDLVIQRTMWKLYQFKYKGYNPEQDKQQ